MRFNPTHIISRFVSGIGALFKNHYEMVLFALFMAAMGFWGSLFFEYVYHADQRSEVTVRTVKIKKDDLETILADINIRQKASIEAQNKTFSNPFTEPPRSQ
ncbi:hypothetical protein HY250_00785 [Candidatus Azambacteria bacterium]|nr:hypothetical protein [Candidatus Azambacteria bacterium]MBI3684931.1 hypothetical protein [Candidatus Azambacteria bacterium]